MTHLPAHFFQEVESITSLPDKFRWYMVLIVTLSSMNYPDEIPNVWNHFAAHYLPIIPADEKLLAARRIREALTKSVGIVGAAKVNTLLFVISLLVHVRYHDIANANYCLDGNKYQTSSDCDSAGAQGYRIVQVKLSFQSGSFVLKQTFRNISISVS